MNILVGRKLNWKVMTLLGLPAAAAAGIAAYILYKKRHDCDSDEIAPNVDPEPYEQAMTYKELGNKNYKAGRYGRAITLYTQALSLIPPNNTEKMAIFYQNRSAAYTSLSQLNEALDDVNNALKLKPRYIKALMRRSKLYEDLNRVQESLEDITAVCIFEKFNNIETTQRADALMRKAGKMLAASKKLPERKKLPSAYHLKQFFNHFSEFPLDYVVCEVCNKPDIDKMNAGDAETNLVPDVVGDVVASKNGLHETELDAEVPAPSNYKNLSLYIHANKDFNKLLKLYRSEEYTECFDLCEKIIDAAALNGLPQSLSLILCRLLRASFFSIMSVEEEGEKELKTVIDGCNLLLKLDEASSNKLSQDERKLLNMCIVNAIIQRATMLTTIGGMSQSSLMEEYFKQALQYDGENCDVYLFRGQLHMLNGDESKSKLAQQDFKRALTFGPKSAPLVRCYLIYSRMIPELRNGDLDKVQGFVHEMELVLNDLLARPSDNIDLIVEVRTLYGQLLIDVMNWKQALNQFKEIVKLQPDRASAYVLLATATLKAEGMVMEDTNFSETIQLLEKAIELDDTCISAYETLAPLMSQVFNLERCLYCYKRASECTQNREELEQMLALHEVTKAQLAVCEKYNVSRDDFMQMRQEIQRKII